MAQHTRSQPAASERILIHLKLRASVVALLRRSGSGKRIAFLWHHPETFPAFTRRPRILNEELARRSASDPEFVAERSYTVPRCVAEVGFRGVDYC